MHKSGTAAATAGTESTTVGDMYDIAASIETTPDDTHPHPPSPRPPPPPSYTHFL
jgi:hypothetical protein